MNPSVLPPALAVTVPAIFLLLVLSLPLGWRLVNALVLSDFLLMGMMIPALLSLRYPLSHPLFQPVGGLVRLFRLTVWDVIFLVFVGFSCLGLDICAYPVVFARDLGALLLCFLLFRSTLAFMEKDEDRTAVFSWFSGLFSLLLVLLSGAVGMRLAGLEVGSSLFSDTGRLTGLFANPNQLGHLLLGGMPLLVITRQRSPVLRLISYCLAIILAGGVGSRGIFFLTILEVWLLETYFSRRSRSFFRLVGFGTLLSALFFLNFSLADLSSFKRATGQTNRAPLGLDLPREKNLSEAFDAVAHWTIGIGLGCFKCSHRHEVHNTFLSILVESGLGGFTAAGVLALLSLQGAWRTFRSQPGTARDQAFALLIALFFLAAIGQVHNLTRSRIGWFILGLAASFQPFFLRNLRGNTRTRP